MNYIEITNKWLLVYRDGKILIKGYQSYVKVFAASAIQTNIETFETEQELINRISELNLQ